MKYENVSLLSQRCFILTNFYSHTWLMKFQQCRIESNWAASPSNWLLLDLPFLPLLRLPQGRNGPDRRAVRIHPPCRGAVRVHASSRVCEQVMHALWQLPCPPHEHFMTSPTTEYVSGSRTLLARGFGRMEKPLHQAVSASASLSVLPCYVQQPAGVHVRPQCTKRIPRTCYDMYSVYLTSAVCYIPHGGPSMAVWCR